MMNVPIAPRRFLFVEWEGGGNLPPSLALARQLMTRGHAVRMLGEPCNQDEIQAAGCTFISYSQAPHRATKSADADFLRDWEAHSSLEALARLQDRLMYGPAHAYAADTLAELEREPADTVVINYALYGAMAAAEKAQVPHALLVPGLMEVPSPGVPPFGLGLLPSNTVVGRLRDRLLTRFVTRLFARGLPALNATRTQLGLDQLVHPWQQFDRADRVLVLTSQAFDWPASSRPANVSYVGPQLDDPAWAQPWLSPWPADHPDPLILVSFSTTFQNQAAILQRVMDATSGLPVRVLVTLGPTLTPDGFRVPPNVVLTPSAAHAQVFPQTAVVLTHAGHGTVIRALAASIPLVCLPMGRDQPEIAARVVARGAGVRLSPKATVRQVRQAVQRVLADTRFREAAQRLARAIAEEVEQSRAVDLLEELAAPTPQDTVEPGAKTITA
jgi:MGT family glycosyltransferase